MIFFCLCVFLSDAALALSSSCNNPACFVPGWISTHVHKMLLYQRRLEGKGKGKVHPLNRPRRPKGRVEVYLYSFLNLGARWGVGGQRHAPVALPAGKTRYPLYRRLVGPQGRSGRKRKISPPTGIRSQDCQHELAKDAVSWKYH